MKYTVILFIVLSFAFTSCMHTMMIGGHGDHDGHVPTKVTKEVTNNDLTLSVSIDPMKIGSESIIAVSISSKSEITDSVTLHYMITKKSGTAAHSAHNHDADSPSDTAFATIHNSVTLWNGKLSIPFTPTVAGEFVFTAETDVLSAEVPFVVAEEKSSGMGGMMGISSEYWYLGAIAMAGMMVVMWTTRGGIF